MADYKLTPVDFDPFKEDAPTLHDTSKKDGYTLTPVDYDPFAEEPGYLKTVGQGMVRGVEGLASGIGSAVRWAGDVLEAPAISEAGRVASKYWKDAAQTGWEAPDPRINAGTFMENPSLKRAVGIISEAIPSLGAAVTASVATGNPYVGAGLLGLTEGAPQYEEARDAGKSIGEATDTGLSATLGTAILEYLPIGRMLKFKGGMVKGGLRGMVEEGAQEGTQQVWQNFIAKIGYDETRSLAEGLAESIIGGAGSGGVVGGVSGGVNRIKEKALLSGITEPEFDAAQQDIEQQIVDLGADIEKETVGGPEKEVVDLPDVDPNAPKPNIPPFEQWEQGPVEEPPVVQKTGMDKYQNRLKNLTDRYARTQRPEVKKKLEETQAKINELTEYNTFIESLTPEQKEAAKRAIIPDPGQAKRQEMRIRKVLQKKGLPVEETQKVDADREAEKMARAADQDRGRRVAPTKTDELPDWAEGKPDYETQLKDYVRRTIDGEPTNSPEDMAFYKAHSDDVHAEIDRTEALDKFEADKKVPKEGTVKETKAVEPTPLEILTLSDDEISKKYPEYSKKQDGIKKQERAAEQRKNKTIQEIDTAIESFKTEIADWESREYKNNKRVVSAGGTPDDLNSGQVSIGRANENRRKSNIDIRKQGIRELEDAKKRLAKGEDETRILEDMLDSTSMQIVKYAEARLKAETPQKGRVPESAETPQKEPATLEGEKPQSESAVSVMPENYFKGITNWSDEKITKIKNELAEKGSVKGTGHIEDLGERDGYRLKIDHAFNRKIIEHPSGAELIEGIDSNGDIYNEVSGSAQDLDKYMHVAPDGSLEFNEKAIAEAFNPKTPKRKAIEAPKAENTPANEGQGKAEVLNYTQFAAKYGYTTDYDITDHGTLSPSGQERVSKRQKKQWQNDLESRIKSNAEGHKAYRQAILEGTVIDPDGEISKESIEKTTKTETIDKLEQKIRLAKQGIQRIEDLGKMAHTKTGRLKIGYQRTVDDYQSVIDKAEMELTGLVAKEKPAPKETKKAKAPKKTRKSKGPDTIRGTIIAMGYINPVNMKGEVKDMPLASRLMFRKYGIPYDLIEKSLKAEGWLYEDESLMEKLYEGKEFLKRRHLKVDTLERKQHLTEAEKQFMEDMNREPEAPPEGEYVTMNAEELPEGKKLTIIDGNSTDGWDRYEVIEKDPFGITLKDGTTIELSPLDKVDVLVEDVKNIPGVADRQLSLFKPTKGQLNMFGEDITEEAPKKKRAKRKVEKEESRAPREAQIDLFTGKAKEIQRDLFKPFPKKTPILTKAPKTSRVKGLSPGIIMHTTGAISGNSTTVKNSAEVASLLAHIRKSAQEYLFAVTVDKGGKILEIHRYSKGTGISSQVHPVEVAGHVLNIPNADTTYAVHNHPAGDNKPSGEDFTMMVVLGDILKLKGVSLKSLIIAGTEWRDFDGPKYTESVSTKIKPILRNVKMPVKERGLHPKRFVGGQFKNSDQLKAAFKNRYGNKEGFLYLDTQIRDIGFLPFPSGKPTNEIAARFVQEVERLNAYGFAVNMNKPLASTPGKLRFIQAITKNFKGKIHLMDIIEDGRSYRDSGLLPAVARGGGSFSKLHSSNVLYSVKPGEPLTGMTQDYLKSIFHWADHIRTLKDGSLLITKGTRQIKVERVNHIAIDKAAFEIAYRRKPTQEDVAAGAYQNGTITLSDIADRGTVAHESYHFLKESGLIGRVDVNAIHRAIGGKNITEEQEAEWIEQNVMDREMKGRLGKLLQKVRDIIDSFVNLFHRTARGVVRDIERGKFFDRDGKAVQTMVPAYQKIADKWYSQMEQALEKKLPGKGNAAQIAKMVQGWAKKGEYKAEELEWSGLIDFLANKSDVDMNGKVTKAEVMAYLAENRLGIQEVVKGNDPKKFTVAHEDGGLWDVVDKNGDIIETLDTEDEANEFIEDMTLGAPFQVDGVAKFAQYQEPGGENYKELLITLPVDMNKEHKVRAKRLDELDKQKAELQAQYDSMQPGTERQNIERQIRNTDTQIDMVLKEPDSKGARTAYKSQHWDEPNVLAHVRFNERTDADGARVLFIEEIQSDWHQAGRSKGYKNLTGKDYKRRDELSNIPFGKRTEEQQNELDGLTKKIANDSSTVPQAPWKKTWPIKTFQRMVRYAAENGFDKIAWTPGEVQAGRYDLSKQVSRVYLDPVFEIDNKGDGSEKFSHGTMTVTDLGGNEIYNQKVNSAKEIEDLIGKDPAERLINNPTRKEGDTHVLQGEGLKVGGEGMKGFYDRILPAEVNKFFGKKAWGKAKVGTTEIQTMTGEDGVGYSLRDSQDPRFRWEVIDVESGEVVDQLTADENPAEHANVEPQSMKVWQLPITPQMKSKALREGMPAYSLQDDKDSAKEKPMTQKGKGDIPTSNPDGTPEGGKKVEELFESDWEVIADIKKSIEHDADYMSKTFGLRVIAPEADYDPKIGDIQPPSRVWVDNFMTDEVLDGTSAMIIETDETDGIYVALKNLGVSEAGIGKNGYYFGKTVVLLKGDEVRYGEDHGEVLLDDAEVVAIYNKKSEGLSRIYKKIAPIPNPPSAPGKGAPKYSAKQKEHAKTYDKFLEDAAGTFGPKPETISLFQRAFGTPFWNYRKIPALKKIFEAGLEWTNNKVKFLRDLLYNEAGIARNAVMNKLARKDPAGFKVWQKWINGNDIEGIGYKVSQDEDDPLKWRLFNPKGEELETFEGEKADDEAWEVARKLEAADFVAEGGSPEWAAQLVEYRVSTRNIFKQYQENIRRFIQDHIDRGEEVPEVVWQTEDGEMRISLESALNKMGDRQGYYMPRLREQGRLVLIARKKGENPIRKHFELGMMNQNKSKAKTIANYGLPVMREYRKLKKKGYSVVIEQSDKMPEDVFLDLAGQRIAMNAIINKSLANMDSMVNLKDLGLKGKWVEDGDKKRYEITGAPTKEIYKEILTDLGGDYHYKVTRTGGTPTWVFRDAPDNIETQIQEMVFQTTGVNSNTMMLFGAELAKQVANIEKSRGSRSRMIGRKDAYGKDVWLGYEENPIIALTKAAQGAAGGEAKRIMAEKMVKLMMGTTESWRDYKARVEDAKWTDYMEEVNARKVDPTTQEGAYKDGMSYIKNMLRNDEAADRILGTIKGLAVLKYLGFRPAAPLVNLTAMVTTVPATFKAHGINFNKVPRYLASASRAYLAYKKGNASREWTQIFDHIKENGWDKAQYNKEALEVLKSKVGRGWDNVLEASMWMFGKTEELNRIVTISAAAKALNKQGVVTDELMENARRISDEAHGVYGKVNAPMAGRGSSAAAQVFKSFYVFRTFSHQYLLNLKDMFSEGQYQAALYMMLSPAILAGAGASVATPIVAAFLKALGMDDPEEEFYRWVENEYGPDAEGYARFGLMKPTGINIKGSLEVSVFDVPTNFKELFGAPGSMVTDASYGANDLFRGNAYKGIEKLLPNAFAAPMKAYREHYTGITTRTDAPVFYGKKPLKSSTYDAILRAFSFNPADLSAKRQKQWKEKKVTYKYSDRRNDIYAKIKRFYLLPANKRTKGAWADILVDIEEYNDRARRAMVRVPPITRKTIKTNLKRWFRPSKRERNRT